MENPNVLWQRCLKLIAVKVSSHTFDVWFKDITFESYDADKNTVLITVPHRYVYEYLEEVQAPVLKQALDAVFGADIRLNYRIAKDSEAGSVLDGSAVKIDSASGKIPQFSIPNACERMEKGLRHFLGDRAQWLPCYDQVSDWLSDNKGRGLLCVGTSGLGKTVICEKILPVILGRKVATVNAQDLRSRLDDLMNERIVIIDDLGKEDLKHYGQTDRSFFKLCDAAEQRGILLIITTNLATTPKPQGWDKPWPYPTSIQERYGNEVISRLRATTHAVRFEGPDLRR